MRSISKVFFVIFFMLSSVSTAYSFSLLGNPIAADEVSYRWVESEFLIFNTNIKNATMGRSYNEFSAEELAKATEFYCKQSETVIQKISQIDISGNNNLQVGFRRGLEHIATYRCEGASPIFTASELSIRHREFMRALAYISVSKYKQIRID